MAARGCHDPAYRARCSPSAKESSSPPARSLAAVAASASGRACWPRLGFAGLVAVALAVPWWIWFAGHGLPAMGLPVGPSEVCTTSRGAGPRWSSSSTTLFEPDFWFLAPGRRCGRDRSCPLGPRLDDLDLCVRLPRGRRRSGRLDDLVGGISRHDRRRAESGHPSDRDVDSRSPRADPAAPREAWSRRRAGISSMPPAAALGPDVFVWRSHLAWAIVLAAARRVSGVDGRRVLRANASGRTAALSLQCPTASRRPFPAEGQSRCRLRNVVPRSRGRSERVQQPPGCRARSWRRMAAGDSACP